MDEINKRISSLRITAFKAVMVSKRKSKHSCDVRRYLPEQMLYPRVELSCGDNKESFSMTAFVNDFGSNYYTVRRAAMLVVFGKGIPKNHDWVGILSRWQLMNYSVR